MIATYLTDMVSVSIYSIYNLIITGINNISSIFLSGLQSAFGEIIVGDDKEKLSNIYNQFSFAFYGIISVIFSIAAVMIMPFINEDNGSAPKYGSHHTAIIESFICKNVVRLRPFIRDLC